VGARLEEGRLRRAGARGEVQPLHAR
jgi:hypothetical protein